MTTPLNVE